MTYREFIARHSGPSVTLPEKSARLLAEPEFREGLLREIHNDPSVDASALLREILRIEEDVRRHPWKGLSQYSENLFWCAFLLWRAGDVHDVIALWRVKNIDFDAYLYFDVQCLVGAGVAETIRYLEEQDSDESKEALAYILSAGLSGEFDDLQAWAAHKAAFFAG